MADEAVFERVKAFLMESDSTGRSTYDHLEEIVLQLLDENAGDIAHHPEKFAEVSSLLKKNGFRYGEESLPSKMATPLPASRIDQFSENKALFTKPPPEVVTTIEQPTPFTTVTTTTVKPPVAPRFSSVVHQNQLWRYCGVGLPEQEAFLLEQSITRLAMQKKLEEVRFVGKIFGTRSNYLVVSSKRFVGETEKVYEEVNTMPKPPRKKVEVDVQLEPAYKGLNRLSYWVASSPSSEWTLLGDTTPQQINAARKVKKLFTGDLHAPVICSPAFDGDESVYLRAQLSRLLSATYISPSGALEKVEPEDDDDGKKKGPKEAKYTPATRPSKEYAPDEEAGVHALLDLEQWTHSEGHIFENGRQTKIPEKPEVEGEEEEAKEEEADEEQPEEEVEKPEEEEKELFLPVKKDYLYAVINIPKEPSPEDGDDADAGEEEAAEEGEDKEEEENKPIEDEEIADDDPLKKKITAWTSKAVNTTFKKHSVAVVRSLRWPGAVAFAAQGAKLWGSVYFGNGLKKTDTAFTPVPAPPIQKEAPDITEVMDATAATEKLVLRGEEPKENDSEDEKEEEEPEEEA
eukprot:CAMPEP_0176428400 /NCGR_PEP_ID=MMETSP0127-20121128/13129_1 /TAXON_ID=938130 /ORGANISM="Platyophrya macrostoma, Strain WH" /LENGTH=572 /DNA_ID=CAMNT_0017810079 /DNA_START=109 /DNA_END=1828 /DNA_ORIENTATION=+